MPNKYKRQRPSFSASGKPFEFNPDYSQTKRDLRRIGLLAGTFIIILVILSFFQDKIVALFTR